MIRAALLLALACGPALAESGKASWYGGKRSAACHGYPTAAHRTARLGSLMRVARGSRSVVVCISDRGPFRAGRLIDMDHAGAVALGMLDAGVVRVSVERIR